MREQFDLEQMLETLEQHLPRMNQYDRRLVGEWKARQADSDPFTTQELRDIREMVEAL